MKLEGICLPIFLFSLRNRATLFTTAWRRSPQSEKQSFKSGPVFAMKIRKNPIPCGEAWIGSYFPCCVPLEREQAIGNSFLNQKKQKVTE